MYSTDVLGIMATGQTALCRVYYLGIPSSCFACVLEDPANLNKIKTAWLLVTEISIAKLPTDFRDR